MKNLVITLLLALVGMTGSANAQINVNVNIGAQPAWGPAGYNYAEYYYLPDIQTYYYVPKRQFVYLNNGNWVFSNSLPARYSGYNLYNGYKVVLNSPKPYLNFNSHKVKYAKYKNLKGRQPTLKGKSTAPGQVKKHYSAGKQKGPYASYKSKNNGKGDGNGSGKGKGNKKK